MKCDIGVAGAGTVEARAASLWSASLISEDDGDGERLATGVEWGTSVSVSGGETAVARAGSLGDWSVDTTDWPSAMAGGGELCGQSRLVRRLVGRCDRLANCCCTKYSCVDQVIVNVLFVHKILLN